jgi:hypothetical protein
MNGKAVSLASRMPRIGQAYAAPSEATPRKGVACPTDPAPPTAVATGATGAAH